MKADYYKQGIANFVTNDGFNASGVAEPMRVGSLPSPSGELSEAQAMRVYSVEGKSTTLSAGGGGMGGKTGLYAEPINTTKDGKSQTIKANYQNSDINGFCIYHSTYGASGVAEKTSDEYYKGGSDSSLIGMTEKGEGKYRNGNQPSQQYRIYSCDAKAQTVNTFANENYIVPTANGKYITIYYVKDGLITIKGKQYPIKLPDGYYYIRKLSVAECMRLQTVPDWYIFPVSNSQAYKMLGNGWTVEVIKHLLSHIPNWQNEEFEVLSLYDGMSCGQIAMKEMGMKIKSYTAYEIDKYAIQTTQHNFPGTIQKGDAFKVREDDWLNEMQNGT